MKVKAERLIHAPVADTFAAFSDLRNAPERIEAIVRLDVLTDGPMGVGTRFRETRVMFGKEATEEMWVTAYEPHKSMRIEAESCGSHYSTDITFEDHGGQTQVTFEFSARPVTFLARLMTPMGWIMKPVVRKCFAKDLESLGNYLEGGTGERVGSPA